MVALALKPNARGICQVQQNPFKPFPIATTPQSGIFPVLFGSEKGENLT